MSSTSLPFSQNSNFKFRPTFAPKTSSSLIVQLGIIKNYQPRSILHKIKLVLEVILLSLSLFGVVKYFFGKTK
jgi:hypothetical protein